MFCLLLSSLIHRIFSLPFQLHHEATIINLLETIMFHQVSLCKQTLCSEQHNKTFVNENKIGELRSRITADF